MTQQSLTTERSLRRQIVMQWMLIILLIAVAVYAFISRMPKPEDGGNKIVGPVHHDTAKENVRKLRKFKGILSEKGNGVWYSAEELKFYADSIFPKLVAEQRKYIGTHGRASDTVGYEWKVGFYWNLTKDVDRVTKIDFYAVPIFVKGATVLDYFDPDYATLYNHFPKIVVRGRPSRTIRTMDDEELEGNAYNTGTMFP